MIPQPLSTFVLTLVGGGAAQLVAAWLRLPSIVFLLVFGVVLGPDVLGWVQPGVIANFRHYIELMVAVILFTGAMSLRVEEIQAHGRMVAKLLSVGLLATAILTALATRIVLGAPWYVAALFGTLMSVTGPTVVLPLLKRISLRENLHSILKWEAILIDPLGVIATILTLEFILAEQPSLIATLTLLATRVTVGGLLGLAAGLLIAWSLRRRFFLGHDVEELGGLASIALALLFYGAAEGYHHGTGLVTVVVAGTVLGNAEFPYKREITAFKEQVTVVALSILFILLAANVRLAELQAIAGPGTALVAVMMLAIRPASVFLSGTRTRIALREELMLALTAPRGVVAASFAYLIAQHMAEGGRGDASVLVPLSFLVISATVLFSGLLGEPLARLLGVHTGERRALLIVGANHLGRLIAREVASRGVAVRLVDKNSAEVARSRDAGLVAHQGDATDPAFLEEIDLGEVGRVLALTRNEEANMLACAAAADLVGRDAVFRLDDRTQPDVVETGHHESLGQPIAEITASPQELNDAARSRRLRAVWDGAGQAAPGAWRWPLLRVLPNGSVAFAGESRFEPPRAADADAPDVLYLLRDGA